MATRAAAGVLVSLLMAVSTLALPRIEIRISPWTALSEADFRFTLTTQPDRGDKFIVFVIDGPGLYRSGRISAGAAQHVVHARVPVGSYRVSATVVGEGDREIARDVKTLLVGVQGDED